MGRSAGYNPPMIGILGGTFDPIHFGHLRPALDVFEGLGLRELRLVPLRLAVHREQPATPAEIRLEMVRAAVAGHPGLVADDRELLRDGPSYTLHTLQSLRAELGERPLCLLIGADAFNGFLQWYEPERICALAHLVVMQRPGAVLPADAGLRALVQARLASDPEALRAAPAGRVMLYPVTQLAISASDIRRRIAAGRSPAFLLPEPVREIILGRRLYGAR